MTPCYGPCNETVDGIFVAVVFIFPFVFGVVGHLFLVPAETRGCRNKKTNMKRARGAALRGGHEVEEEEGRPSNRRQHLFFFVKTLVRQCSFQAVYSSRGTNIR